MIVTVEPLNNYIVVSMPPVTSLRMQTTMLKYVKEDCPVDTVVDRPSFSIHEAHAQDGTYTRSKHRLKFWFKTAGDADAFRKGWSEYVNMT